MCKENHYILPYLCIREYGDKKYFYYLLIISILSLKELVPLYFICFHKKYVF